VRRQVEFYRIEARSEAIEWSLHPRPALMSLVVQGLLGSSGFNDLQSQCESDIYNPRTENRRSGGDATPQKQLEVRCFTIKELVVGVENISRHGTFKL